ncbi:MAG: TfoX/Sxy family protein [Ectothiorhodospiraceae bacterium]|nr:TfoX/Sxy family protein [Ectothiorhodospiraceae bacterium]
MVTNRKLTDLKNIGTKIAGHLKKAGIFSEEELRFHGPVEAHKMIKNMHPKMCLPVCYYLYSFEGALNDKHWNEIGDEQKLKLKKAIGK